MSELVSIVFTSYNHREYLEQALLSILNQTYKHTEIILVDDCSTDNSQEILRKYADHPSVQLHLLEKNTGSYVKASNYGARFAQGEYLLFAQCDDFCEPHQIETLIDAFRKNPGIGVAYSRSKLVDEKGGVFSDDFVGREHLFRKKCSQDTLIKKQEMRRFLFFACVIPNLSAALIRRSLYNGNCVLSEKYIVVADWAMWLNIAEKTDFYYISSPLNYFRQHNTTIRSQVKLKTQVAEIYALFYNFAKESKLGFYESLQLRTYVGSIWFWYYLDSPTAWRKSFSPLLKETFRYEKLNLLFLFGGLMVYVREFLYRRILKR